MPKIKKHNAFAEILYLKYVFFFMMGWWVDCVSKYFSIGSYIEDTYKETQTTYDIFISHHCTFLFCGPRKKGKKQLHRRLHHFDTCIFTIVAFLCFIPTMMPSQFSLRMFLPSEFYSHIRDHFISLYIPPRSPPYSSASVSPMYLREFCLI